ncbi:metalloendoproteinase 4-MMP [Helianthus annuus]|uniref:metalloendoproteinase 4-MMP n=1 Tax=Helianthus annuus TaxID=4232 RepID=UPI000B8EFC95|nr:metalloendoproteinase 4-MMP [Helianthus annuus]
MVIIVHNFTDVFDDTFESAVVNYQKNLGLTVTGKLDAVTVTQIMSPFCGLISMFPRYDYSTADIKIGFYKGDHGDGEPFDSVLGVLAQAFSPKNGRLHLDEAETWAVDFKSSKTMCCEEYKGTQLQSNFK